MRFELDVSLAHMSTTSGVLPDDFINLSYFQAVINEFINPAVLFFCLTVIRQCQGPLRPLQGGAPIASVNGAV